MPNCSWRTENRVTKPTNDKKVTKASDLNVGTLVFVKDHCKGHFDPMYTFDHRIAAIVNESTVLCTIPDGKERRCNIHHIKPMSVAESSAGAFQQFLDSIQKHPVSIQQGHQYNLHARFN